MGDENNGDGEDGLNTGGGYRCEVISARCGEYCTEDPERVEDQSPEVKPESLPTE